MYLSLVSIHFLQVWIYGIGLCVDLVSDIILSLNYTISDASRNALHTRVIIIIFLVVEWWEKKWHYHGSVLNSMERSVLAMSEIL